MKKRLFTALLALLLLGSVLGTAVRAEEAPTEEKAYQAIIAVKSQYPDGLRYDEILSHMTKGEFRGSCWYSAGWSAGFGLLLSDAAFGELPYRDVPEFAYGDLRVGDLLELKDRTPVVIISQTGYKSVYDNPHYLVILEILPDRIVAADGDDGGFINWNRAIPKDQVTPENYLLITRYPQGTPAHDPEGAAKALAAQTVLSKQGLMVDGETVACEKYNIGGSNYFKLRDIAMLLNRSDVQFSVTWDTASGTVAVNAGQAYEPDGSELVLGEDKSATAVPGRQTVKINGVVRSDLSVFNIGGNNYFKLRDLGIALGFTVDYDAASNSAVILRSAPQPAPAYHWLDGTMTVSEILDGFVWTSDMAKAQGKYVTVVFTVTEGQISSMLAYRYYVDILLNGAAPIAFAGSGLDGDRNITGTIRFLYDMHGDFDPDSAVITVG